MAYYVLNRPEGTLATKPSLGRDVLSSLTGGLGKGIRNEIAREALRREGLEREVIYDPETGEQKETWGKPKAASTGDISKRFLQAITGLRGMEDIVDVENVAPRKVGEAAGGEVLAPAGSTYKDGYIYDPSGKIIGEYEKGHEPTPSPDALRSQIVQSLEKKGITKSEMERKALGLPKATKAPKKSFNDYMKDAIEGNMKWEDLKMMYPSPNYLKRIKEAQSYHKPAIEKSGQFKEGYGLPAFFNKNIAKLNTETKNVIQQIESAPNYGEQEELILELLDREEEAKKKGVDLKAIFEYFGVDRSQFE